jgi:hypothetical protein
MPFDHQVDPEAAWQEGDVSGRAMRCALSDAPVDCDAFSARAGVTLDGQPQVRSTSCGWFSVSRSVFDSPQLMT